tara:strand:+ start:135 stop:1217 length:1083 start_codon:yes stop_codon:yes gene_type:complete
MKLLIIQKRVFFIQLIFLPLIIVLCNQKFCNYCNKELQGQYIIHKNNNYHHHCYDKHIQIYCDQCGLKIDGSFNSSNGKNYHKTCYQQYIQKRCDECGDLINSIYNIKDGKEYHESCYIEYILPKCDICKQPVEDTYIEDFWGNYYHEYHSKKMPDCDNCSRLICDPLTGGGYSVNSQRFVCNICKPKVITKRYQIEPNLREVLVILNSVGINNLPKKIPITLVDSREDLIRLSGNRLGNIQGYTNYEVSTLSGTIIDQDYHIYILSNLHGVIFNAVLAHELLHVYLFQNDLELEPDIREGFCNLGSNIVYEHYGSNLSRYRIKSMDESSDPDYGLGYKKMKSVLDQIGWKRLLRKLDRL